MPVAAGSGALDGFGSGAVAGAGLGLGLGLGLLPVLRPGQRLPLLLFNTVSGTARIEE